MTEAQSEWARCRDHIVAALATSPGFETIEDVERKLADGQYQFWPGINSAAVTEVIEYDAKRLLMVQHGGGDLHELMEVMEPKFCDFARHMGCEAIGGTGRRGWERVSAKHGYRFGVIIMFKDLQH